VEQLGLEIPFYRERLLIQPGITGWAQVNYPYGASVADARRKLEYDLYYAKNMSLVLDVFILLDTVRIILGGGMQKPKEFDLLHKRKLKTSDTDQVVKSALTNTNETPA
jgi:lipopolysaccharide/colanic/teichoic acid biosynthesis glycosyltransferase